MVVVDVQPNGQAPQGLSSGDFVKTAGGMYQITDPGTYGAVYNPNSGYWSLNTNSDNYRIMSLINSAKASAEQNTMTSQEFAREQMAFQQNSAEKAMKFSSEQAELQRLWQEGLANNAHQREVRDLIAAGLNPILSAGGSGSTTPSGASATGVSANGAQGSVDMGGTAAASQLLATMINNQTSLDITKLQTAATMYAADRGLIGSQSMAGATLGASAQSAAATIQAALEAANATRYAADMNYKNQRDNPQSIAANVRGAFEGLVDTLTSSSDYFVPGSGESAFQRLFDTKINVVKMVDDFSNSVFNFLNSKPSDLRKHR